MATFKPVVRNKRSDDTYLVYIRCTHNRKVEYIKTAHYVSSRQVKDGEIKDYDVLGQCALKIKEWNIRLNREDIYNWSVNEVVNFINSKNENISFSDYCTQFINKMINEGREKSASNYECAVKSFQNYVKGNIAFQDINSKIINDWIKSLSNTARAKEAYPKAIKTIFDAGCLEYNDYDRNIIRIQNQPFRVVKIPKADVPQKKAESADVIRTILSVTPDTKRSTMAQDVAKLILYLVGINTVDLFYMDKACYDGDKIRYNRRKTKNGRSDKAYIEIAVHDEIKPLFDKYKGDKTLFKWGYSDPQSFNKYVNFGLKRLCEIAEVKNITSYTFRHSWATIAQNKCGASTELVAFCLNHTSAHKVTEGYIEKDFTPIDKLNNKVLDYIFQRGEYKKKEAD